MTLRRLAEISNNVQSSCIYFDDVAGSILSGPVVQPLSAGPAGLINLGVMTLQVTGVLTPAQLRLLPNPANFITAIPAAGPNTLIFIVDVEFSLQLATPANGGIPYAGANFPTLYLYYVNPVGNQLIFSVTPNTNSWLVGTTAGTYLVDGTVNSLPGPVLPPSCYNVPIMFTMDPSSTITQGNAPIKYTINYRIINV